MGRQQIPVVVLAGFLGSGKTTLLNHLLRSSRGTRIGALVNDFGAIEIDAMTVAGQVGSTVSLGNGCLCCAVDVAELDTYLERLTRPEAGLDVIVVEASGLAEPVELVRMILASENPHTLYGGLVEVVDAAEYEATRERHPEVDRHLAAADLVVLNKTDRVAPAELDRLLAAVRERAEHGAVTTASYGRIDPELLFDRRPQAERYGQLSFDDAREEDEAEDGACADHGDDHDGHLHAAYDSAAFSSATPLHPRLLMDFLDARPEGLYRIKGVVDFGPLDPDHVYTVHAVGRFLRFAPRPWEPGEEHRSQLVLIGSGIDPDALTTGLDGCRDLTGEADERHLWSVLRFVREDEDTADPDDPDALRGEAAAREPGEALPTA
ncbi:CobW family GTP-binding protein [Streptomyces sp. NPDC058374]|uniref:CobW family GTP-binding protein n=1 Tax=unclassified Streptomyces TaxID=2593676 RepID=UPI003665D0FA